MNEDGRIAVSIKGDACAVRRLEILDFSLLDACIERLHFLPTDQKCLFDS